MYNQNPVHSNAKILKVNLDLQILNMSLIFAFGIVMLLSRVISSPLNSNVSAFESEDNIDGHR